MFVAAPKQACSLSEGRVAEGQPKDSGRLHLLSDGSLSGLAHPSLRPLRASGYYVTNTRRLVPPRRAGDVANHHLPTESLRAYRFSQTNDRISGGASKNFPDGSYPVAPLSAQARCGTTDKLSTVKKLFTISHPSPKSRRRRSQNVHPQDAPNHGAFGTIILFCDLLARAGTDQWVA